ncbi:MAG: primosomal protein N' [Pseudonocardia sp.]|nr:primosomal protein N' [Pseudonocardia sp.]
MTRATRARGEWRPAATLPVARVAVDVALAHLDRPFDYRVPAHLDEAAAPGVRVRVRFAGRLVDGFLLERVADTDHAGRLAWVDRVVSPEPVLTAEVAALCRAVADRYAGVLADVLRLAVPPRHARVEAEAPVAPGDAEIPGDDGAPGWARYPRGPALLDALAGGRAAHAVWQALPGESWADRLAEAAAATVRAGRGALLVVPDQRDVAALHAACTARLGERDVVALTAELGPAERYRRWLTVRRGAARVVVGTRSAVFAPLDRPGLLAVWDDGDDLHAEPRAPYPHVRDVLVLRAHAAGAALLVGGFARTAEAQVLVESGWARDVVADRATVRAAAPRITALNETGDQVARDPDQGAARLPAVAFEAARAALTAGLPVLVQVPRAGYLPWLACAQCRETARCRHCAGPLGMSSGAARREPGSPGGPSSPAGSGPPPQGRSGERPDPGGAGLPHCRWCGRVERVFRCPVCASQRLRAGVVGAGRTAEELGRAFPGATVRTSGGSVPVLDRVPGRPELVVATPGAEPPAEGGYGAALLLDGWAMLSRPDLRVAEETLRRWMGAAALVVPAADGGRLGRVVVVAEAGLPPVQALVRWDPAWHAAAELAARTEVGFPPAVRMASVEGTASAVAEVVDTLLGDGTAGGPQPPDVEVLGPVELDPEHGADPAAPPRERALVRVPRAQGRALAAALAAVAAGRSARKAPDPVRVRLDPPEVG